MDSHEVPSSWNIIFLIYAELMDGARVVPGAVVLPTDSAEITTLSYLDTFLGEIENIEISDNFNVFVIENKVYLDADQMATGDETTLKQLKATPGDPGENLLVELEPTDMTPHFAQNPDMITAAFKRIVAEKNADKNMLYTWDHGSGFGIFKNVEQDITKSHNAEEAFTAQYEAFTIGDQFESVTGEDEETELYIVRNKPVIYKQPRETFKTESHLLITEESESFLESVVSTSSTQHVEILTNHELATAIIEGLGKKVEMLLMFNCCMQNMHTGYALKDSVNYLIAPEGIISMPGYDYVTVAQRLKGEPEMEGDILAALALDCMEAKFTAQGLADKFKMHAMFAIKFDNYAQKVIAPLVTLSNDLITFINSATIVTGTTNKALVLGSRVGCYEMTYPLNYYIIDIINWLIRLKEKTLNDTYAVSFNHADYVVDCNSLICASKVAGVSAYTLQNFDRRNKPSGFAMYFPPGKVAYDPLDLTRINFIEPGAVNQDFLITNINWLPLFSLLFN